MKQLIAIIIIFSFSFSSFGQSIKPAEFSATDKERVDNIFKGFEKSNSPGYAVGISVGGQTLYAKGYGSANLEYEIPITPSSAFDIASVSKQFTGAVIALLILDKRLTLETPVSKFIPAVGKYKDTIRVKHLIYNTSGIVDYFRLARQSGKS